MTSVRVRSALWLMTGVALSLITTIVFHGIQGAAAPGSGESTFVPVSPCRLFDYRPAPNTVGPRSSALGAGESAVQQVTGAIGTCNIPSGATAVAMNVTIVAPTAASFLSVYPANLAQPPKASNLNWSAGQAPTPNKVDVKLSPTGAIRLFNKQGKVNVLADVVGYYTRSGIADLDARIAALENNDRPIVASAHRDSLALAPGSIDTVLMVTIDAPVAGVIQIVGTVYTYGDVGSLATCRLGHNGTFTADLDDTDRPYVMAGLGNGHCATSGAIAVDPGTHVINLVAQSPTNGGIDDASLDALFVPGGTVTDFATNAVFGAGATLDAAPGNTAGAED